ncbi:GNAT family N-acetyltransferase [Lysinibacillus louembei]|uniref:GNAT family N-acetyltransferase n=1 Tax=Lysinibacillus louembei TaxID=1470088 RepID=A0ABZ0RVH8_9BACI|nr:GNAT family N-acetyltransferase [Lysinibacillus louembei]WPK11414.1 GNAT family N-acetyltransferase [Lysinibacillus louembei]
MVTLRHVEMADLEQLIGIENEGFSSEEAATKEAFIERIQLIADTFIVAESDGKIAGYINGPVISQPYITDDLFKKIVKNPPKGGYQSVLGVAVTRHARNQGIASMLIKKMEELNEQNGRQGITLTCKQELIAFYEKLGFVNEGLSESSHAGIDWYNMVKTKKSY